MNNFSKQPNQGVGVSHAMRAIIGTFAMVGLLASGSNASAQNTNAYDVAANYDGFSGNHGFGFGPWVLNVSGNGGYYISSGTPPVFGIWNGSADSQTTALRTFNSPLSVGGTFSVQMRLQSLDFATTVNGFRLQDANGNELFSYYHAGGDDADGHYTDAGGSGTATGFAYNYGAASTFTFTLTSATTYTFFDDTTGATLSGTLSGGPVTQVTFFRQNGADAPTSNGQDLAFDALTITSSDVLPPVFTLQPSYQGGMVGSTLTLAASAFSSQPVSYQWYHADAPVAGATSTNLVLSNVDMSKTGGYWVVATADAGSATSSVAQVTLYVENNRLLAYEGFDYDPDQSIADLNGGFDWASGWSIINGNAFGVYTAEYGLVGSPNTPPGFDDLATGMSLATTDGTRAGRWLDCSTNGVFAQRGFLDAKGNIGADGKTIYVSFLQQPSATTSFYEFEFHRGDFGDAGRIAGIGNDTANTTVNLRAPANTHTPIGEGDVNVNFYVVRIDFKAGNDDVRVYRNPASTAEPETPSLTMLGVTDMSFNGFCVASWANYLAIDEIRVGATWEDALGLPVSNVLPLTKAARGWNVNFAATPDFTWRVQSASSVTGPWTDIGTATPPESGLGTVIDTNPSSNEGFYRAVTP